MASPAAVFARLSDKRTPTAGPVLMKTAVVLGGSVAGLLAARVLADHADEVIVVERDDPGTSTRPRPGVPHGAQAHVLLPAGLAQLERFFPGFADEGVAAGGRLAPASHRHTFSDGVLKVPGRADAVMLCGSRPFLEALIRKRTLALPNVRALTARVTGLEFAPDAVSGVRYESDGAKSVLKADFVVDATGRASRLGDWLENAGWDKPALTRVEIDLNYATAIARRTPDQPGIEVGLATYSPGSVTEGVAAGAFCSIEDERWMVLLSGYVADKPGRTPEDLVRLCKASMPEDFGAIVTAGIDSLATYHLADARRRNFHDLSRVPARLVALGDSVASMNPIYAQGMTSAALQASALSEFLRSQPSLDVPAREFFALQKIVVDAPWDVATGADLSLPHVQGPRPSGYAVKSWAGKQVVAASVRDSEINRRFESVIFLLEHPSILATPGTLLRSVRVNRRARRG
ncbi:FAD-dependent monooxygenase [Lentzea sp. NBRC 102530]|uniref:FAD-dependent oxidoreductase n=1 Tax=Lentzea sp. NBRC 102530 TaxID=3032201 RepID=UPI0024A336CD|nr:FAD-dependent monooxygenase [Lentzea sp. NBRC 102530]GLY51458.1 hydroxylase [Lentzea sp. NBRC 102530]